jgi:hypothetical protein
MDEWEDGKMGRWSDEIITEGGRYLDPEIV